MKSNTIFDGVLTKDSTSRVPKRTLDLRPLEGAKLHARSNSLSTSLPREESELKLFKQYLGHKDGEVNGKMGKAKNSNHVNALRLKMFYSSQIVI